MRHATGFGMAGHILIIQMLHRGEHFKILKINLLGEEQGPGRTEISSSPMSPR